MKKIKQKSMIRSAGVMVAVLIWVSKNRLIETVMFELSSKEVKAESHAASIWGKHTADRRNGSAKS